MLVEENDELRIRIPQRLHTQLRALRILRGQGMAATIEKAIDGYVPSSDPPRPHPERRSLQESPSFIHEPSKVPVPRELKVIIPTRLLVRLHAIKLAHRDTMQVTVEHALDHYFESLRSS